MRELGPKGVHQWHKFVFSVNGNLRSGNAKLASAGCVFSAAITIIAIRETKFK